VAICIYKEKKEQLVQKRIILSWKVIELYCFNYIKKDSDKGGGGGGLEVAESLFLNFLHNGTCL